MSSQLTASSSWSPALANAAGTYAGGLLGVTDTTADSLAFARALLQRCQGLGVKVRLGSAVSEVVVQDGQVVGALTDHGLLEADLVVLAAGAYTPHIKVPHARPVPIYPARGFAMDVPIRDPHRAPVLGGLDERRLVAWSRTDHAVRFAAVAQFAGFDRRIERSARDTIVQTGEELFGDALDWSRADLRVGYRLRLRHGPPIIGPSRVSGLFYNAGHGHMGWTMACGSALILRDLVLGRRPEIDTTGITTRSTRW